MSNNSLIKFSTVYALSHEIKNGNISPTELVSYYIQRIDRLNIILNSFVTIIREQAFDQAHKLEKELNKGICRGYLHGIPFSIKDIISAKNIKLTAGSKIFSHNISESDSVVVRKMKNAGAILLGTNSLDEFASGITGINSFFGRTNNPWELNRLSGGSSSGSAVAVAADLVPISIGTDTGGSIRVPASFCGAFGFKPTYNTVSIKGIFDLSPTLDHVGFIARSPLDLAIVFRTTSKNLHFSNFKVHENSIFSYFKYIERQVENRKKTISIAIPNSYFLDYLDQEVRKTFETFIRTLNSKKIQFTSVNMETNTELFLNSWINIRLPEASAIHKNLMPLHLIDYTKEVRRSLIQGTKITALQYIESLKLIQKIKKDFLRILDRFDFIVVPTTIITAPLANEKYVQIDDKKFKIRDALLRNTAVFNSTGFPSLSIPFDHSKDTKMPIGIQIISKPYDDYKILAFAYSIDKYLNYYSKFKIQL